jgi:hypothetical protein
MSANLDQFQNASVGMTVGIIEVRYVLSILCCGVVRCAALLIRVVWGYTNWCCYPTHTTRFTLSLIVTFILCYVMENTLVYNFYFILFHFHLKTILNNEL